MKNNNFTQEQIRAYGRYVKALEKVKLVRTSKNYMWEYVPHSDVLGSVKADGDHHPLFIPNEIWLEYKEAFEGWLAVEPEFRKTERMRASYGDYGDEDSWDEESTEVKDTYQMLKGEE